MTRTKAALAVREWYRSNGVTVVTHDEWKSLYDYSGGPSRSPLLGRRYLVGHHNGASAQLPHIQRNINNGLTPVEAGKVQMRRVDQQHFYGNEWLHGFAYCGMWLPLGDDLVWFEGRSAWWPHGAHRNDALRRDWPVYYALGSQENPETAPTDLQKVGWATDTLMLSEVFGWQPSEATMKLHREVQGWNTTQCCDPVMGNFIRQYRSNPTPPPPSDPEGDGMYAYLTLEILQATLDAGAWGGDPTRETRAGVTFAKGVWYWAEQAERARRGLPHEPLDTLDAEVSYALGMNLR